MPPQGVRLCTCPSCGARGQAVPVGVYRQHQQRQRRRTDRAETASLLASLLRPQETTPSGVQGGPAIPSDSTNAPHRRPSHIDLVSRPSLDRHEQVSQTSRSAAGSAGTLDPAVPAATTIADTGTLPQPERETHSAPLDEDALPVDELLPVDDDHTGLQAHRSRHSPAANGDELCAGEMFSDAFFGEDDEATNEANDEATLDEAGADADADADVLEPVDEEQLYSSTTPHEERIATGLVDPHDFPHGSGSAAVQPRWQMLTHIFAVWLSSKHRISEQVASTLLRFVAEVLVPALGGPQQPNDSTLRLTLAAAKSSLGLQPPLVRYVVCPRCSNLYPWSLKNAIKTCSACGEGLHQPSSARLSSPHQLSSARPRVFFTVSPVRTWIEALLLDREIEDALDEAFARQSGTAANAADRVYRDIDDGEQWRASITPDGRPFANDPLSLQLTLGVDGFSPFKVGGSSWHSSGAITMMVNNLPGHLRHRHAHLAGITPGPQDPSDIALAKYLAPIVAELRLLEDGIWITTPRHGQPRLVRARLLLFCGDTPARAKVCGFLGHKAAAFCPYCRALKALRHLLPSDFAKRCAKEHRDNAILARREQADPQISQTALAENIRRREARWSQLYDLPYWHSVTSAPPEAMHAVFLGIVKRFWHRLFVDCIVPMQPALLAQAQRCLAAYKGPLTMKRPDRRLGDRGGGNPNADQWCCLARNILVFQLADLFDDALCEPFADDDRHYVRARYPKTARSAPVKRPFVEDAFRSATNNDAVTRISNAEKAEAAARAAGPAGSSVPADPAATLDVSLSKRDIFLLGMHVAAIAELAYASELTEADVADLERLTEGHLILNRLVSRFWPTVNTHFVLHLPEFVRRFGPCRAWWAFTFERINGWLSGAAGQRSNRKRDGQVEFSMMRAFWDRSAMRFLMQSRPALQSQQLDHEKAFWNMVGKKAGTRSTIDAQADERLYKSHPQYNSIVLNKSSGERLLSAHAAQALVDYLNKDGDGATYQPMWAFKVGTAAVEIRNMATFFASLSFRGQRFVALGSRSNAHEGSTFAIARRAGVDALCQIVHIFEHKRISANGDNVSGQFMEVRWFNSVPWPEGHPMRHHARITRHLKCSLASRAPAKATEVIRTKAIVCQAAVTPCTVGGQHVLGVKHLYK